MSISLPLRLPQGCLGLCHLAPQGLTSHQGSPLCGLICALVPSEAAWGSSVQLAMLLLPSSVQPYSWPCRLPWRELPTPHAHQGRGAHHGRRAGVPDSGSIPGVPEPCPMLPSLQVLLMHKTPPTHPPPSHLLPWVPQHRPWALPFLLLPFLAFSAHCKSHPSPSGLWLGMKAHHPPIACPPPDPEPCGTWGAINRVSNPHLFILKNCIELLCCTRPCVPH